MFSKKDKSIRGYKQARERARKTLSQPERMNNLLEKSKEKLGKLELDEQDFKGILNTLKTFIRMLRSYKSGHYSIPWTTILMVTAALIYFVVPLDMLPDFIPITGYIDDFTVIWAIYKKVKEDVLVFQAWESRS